MNWINLKRWQCRQKSKIREPLCHRLPEWHTVRKGNAKGPHFSTFPFPNPWWPTWLTRTQNPEPRALTSPRDTAASCQMVSTWGNTRRWEGGKMEREKWDKMRKTESFPDPVDSRIIDSTTPPIMNYLLISEIMRIIFIRL